MKKHLLPFMAIALLFVLETSFAQTVVILKSTPANAYEQIVSSDFPTGTGSYTPPTAITGQAWTAGGTPGGWRTYFRFNDSAIGTLIIDSAFLQLYADTTSSLGYYGEPNYGTDNACGVYRVTDAWVDSTLVWNTMPAYTSVDSVVLPQSTSYTENYLHIDVTYMLNDIVRSGNNYGFMMKSLQEITPYNSMIFYSTSATDSSVRPQILVYGHIPSAVNNIQKEPGAINIFPNPAAGMLSVTTTGIISHIAVLNLLGETLYTQQCNAPNAQVNIANLSPGIYLVKINDCYVRKFIKQ